MAWKSNISIVKRAERREASKLVMEIALAVEGEAKTLAAVDTGFMRNSIQTTQVGEFVAEVSVGAEYGVHVEFGTRYQRAQPFLLPALDEVAQRYDAKVIGSL